MPLRNRHGRAVDAVPFLVVSGMVFLVSFSFGPIYLAAIGVTGVSVIGGSAAVFVLGTAGAYYRLVWTYRPDLRGAVSAAVRIERLLYAALIATVLVVALTLPLLVT